MYDHVNRREFLKIAALLSLGLLSPKTLVKFGPVTPKNQLQPNVLIIVFDAFSACHTSIYGYPRETLPKITQLAEKATIYRNHYTNGSFTTPGTASLLTGVLPFSHRALTGNGKVKKEFVKKSIFHAFEKHYRMAYTHNIWADTILKQFREAIEDYTPRKNLYIKDVTQIHSLFWRDDDIASVAWARTVGQGNGGHPYSILLSYFHGLIQAIQLEKYKTDFPRFPPNIGGISYYVLEPGIDWLQTRMLEAPKPFFGYYHFFPPHSPYSTRKDFIGRFTDDGFAPQRKPTHLFTEGYSDEKLEENRIWYDEYLLYVDAEFARLHSFMGDNGLLENTWVIFTSDHGELFERGILGHDTPVFYEPLIRIPLIIFPPGQKSRIDIFDRTSAIDILPTLMQIIGQPIPEWAEGDVMPPYNSSMIINERDIISVRGEALDNNHRLKKGSATLIRGDYKLTYTFGNHNEITDGELIELFNLMTDPEELNNIRYSEPFIAEEMLRSLQFRLRESEQDL